MHTVTGNLITLAQQGHFDVIIHGCNCFCTMGAGIAKGIKHAFPAAYAADLATPKGERAKLGTYSKAEVSFGEKSLTIVNAYTQFNWRKGKERNADYDAIRSVFRALRQDFSGKRIGYPAIGAGLAGGDWAVISQIIAEALAGEDHTFVRFSG